MTGFSEILSLNTTYYPCRYGNLAELQRRQLGEEGKYERYTPRIIT